MTAIGLIGGWLGGLWVGIGCLLLAVIIAVLFGLERIRNRLGLPGATQPEVSAEHRQQLQDLAAAYVQSVGYWRCTRGKQHPRLEHSFWSHFPQAGRLLERWDEAVAVYDRTAGALRGWLTANADGLHAIASIHRAVENGTGLNWSVNSGYLWLDGGMGVAPLVDEAKVEALKRPYEELLTRARLSPEGRALSEATLETRATQQSALSELAGIQALHVVRGRCDLCR